MKKISLLIFLILIISGCSYLPFNKKQAEMSNPVIDIELAKLSVNNFLSMLNLGQYEQAVFYYGGSFSELESLNPEISKDSKSKLLERYCLNNNGLCLKPMLIKEESISDSEYKVTVQFFNQDGSLFATSGCPCKGGGKNQFEFTVKKITEGQFLVMDLPPLKEVK